MLHIISSLYVSTKIQIRSINYASYVTHVYDLESLSNVIQWSRSPQIELWRTCWCCLLYLFSELQVTTLNNWVSGCLQLRRTVHRFLCHTHDVLFWEENINFQHSASAGPFHGTLSLDTALPLKSCMLMNDAAKLLSLSFFFQPCSACSWYLDNYW